MIKITLEEEDIEEKPHYPCLKQSSEEIIVLFTEQNRGVMLSHSNCCGFGEYRTNWIEDNFKLLDKNKKIILSNDN